MINSPFSPCATTTKVSASTTTATGTMAQGGHVRIHNATTSLAFIKFSGAASPEATADDLPIPAGAIEVLDAGSSKYVAVILAAGTGDVYFTPGRGL